MKNMIWITMKQQLRKRNQIEKNMKKSEKEADIIPEKDIREKATRENTAPT